MLITGRIWLLWDKSMVTLIELMRNAQLLHYKVSITGGNLSFLYSMVYAFNAKVEQESLWKQFTSLGSVSEPWLVLADLNRTLKHDEKMKNCGFYP